MTRKVQDSFKGPARKELCAYRVYSIYQAGSAVPIKHQVTAAYVVGMESLSITVVVL